MIAVTDAFKLAVEAQVRQWRTTARLEMASSNLTGPAINADSLDADLFPASDLADGYRIAEYKFCFPSERCFPNDDTDPDDPLVMPTDPDWRCGYWGDKFSDVDGYIADGQLIEFEYAEPYPMLQAIPLYFDGWLGYAMDFTVSVYHDGSWEVLANVVDNTDLTYILQLDTPVANVQFLDILVTRIGWNGSPLPDENVRIMEIDAGWVAAIGTRVKSWSVRKERSFASADLPVPSASANSLTLVLDNSDGVFWTRNVASPYYGLLKANQRCWLSVELKVGNVWESIPVGVFYTTKWMTKRSDIVTTITLLDRAKLLQESYFASSMVLTDRTIAYLASVILRDAGLNEDEYVIQDTGLDSIIPYFWTDRVTHWAALCNLYGAEGGRVYVDEYDKVICESREFLQSGEPVVNLSSGQHFKDLNDDWDEALMRTAIVIKSNPLRPRPLEETDIYTSSVELSTGEEDVIFDYLSNEIKVPEITGANDAAATVTWASGSPRADGGTLVISGIIPANQLVVRGKPQKVVVWKSGEDEEIVDGIPLEIETFFDTVPSIDVDPPVFVVRDGDTILEIPEGLTAEWKNGNVYGFGGVILITNNSGATQTIKSGDLWVRGTPLDPFAKEIVTAKDDQQIKVYGRREFVYENQYLQSRALSKALADFLLTTYKDPISPVTLDMVNRGMPHLQLADYVHVEDDKSFVDDNMWINAIDLSFDGGLSGSLECLIAPPLEIIVNSYIITASAGAHGTIDPTGEVEVDEGDDQEFEIVAGGGYQVFRVKIDGENINLETDPNWDGTKNEAQEYIVSGIYTFSNVVADHTIEASFSMPG